jgi:hypothetical protein
LASPPPPARLFFLLDAAHAWREEVDGTTARLGVQHLSNAYFRLLGYPDAALRDAEHALTIGRGTDHAGTLMTALFRSAVLHLLVGNYTVIAEDSCARL